MAFLALGEEFDRSAAALIGRAVADAVADAVCACWAARARPM